MEQGYKLSLFEAILININIMVGAGLFVNTTQLADKVGVFGSATYILIGILLFPLVYSMVKLLEFYPEGGFYIFGKKAIGPLTGFVCAFSYFIGKLASATLVVHIFIYLLQQSFDSIAQYSTFALDIGALTIILAINVFGMKMGAQLQRYLMLVKLFPIIFIILAGLFYVHGVHINIADYMWYNIPLTIPLLLHATSGFEAACSLSRKIKNPEVNASRAVLYSYILVIAIYTLYQLSFYLLLGTDLATGEYSTAFAQATSTLFAQSNTIAELLKDTLYISIAISALSSAFGMFFSNLWNFHILAEHDHTFFKNTFSKINTYGVAPACIAVEGLVALIYFVLSNGNNTVLQQISALGCTTAYTISVACLFVTYYQRKQSTLLPTLGLINCTLFISACVYSLWTTNIYAFIVFSIMLASGIGMFMYTSKNKIQSYN